MASAILGMDSLKKKISMLQKKHEAELPNLLESIGQTIRGNAVRLIQLRSPGTPYIRYNQSGAKRIGVAAQPGSPPNTDTGNLVKDIQVRRINNLAVTIGSSGERAPYGKWLEYGTSKMAPRPWLRPALELSKEVISKKAAKWGYSIFIEMVEK